ncbi:uncharacterized protein TNCV_2865191 [Trichonephila clavipes]|nr:uncharacterized protein TNCV_2865191 [Trichonephila clavipes]
MGHERKIRQKKRKFHGNFRTAQKKIFDIEILMSIFSILSCPVCYNQELYLIEDSRLGLQSNLCLKCKNCSFTKGFTSTSKDFLKGLKQNRSLRYTSYYGDGDSAFNNVKDIHGCDSVVKHEYRQCAEESFPGHVRKPLGGGKYSKLTDKFIDTLQNYFGIAIPSNVGNLSNMQTAVIAAFFHCWVES